MNEPKRLLTDPESSPLQRMLVQAWDDERPSSDARDRVLAALGVASITTAATTSLAAKATGSIAPKAALGLVWTKWIGLGVVASMTLGGSAWWMHERATMPSEVPIATSAPSLPRAPEIVASPETESTSAPLVRHDEGSLGSFAASSARTGHVVRARPPADSLAEELALVDRARTASDPASTIRAVDDYEARFRAGTFLQEAEVLRVKALLRKHDRAGAEAAAERFFSRFPKSPHAAHVRALLDAPSP